MFRAIARNEILNVRALQTNVAYLSSSRYIPRRTFFAKAGAVVLGLAVLIPAVRMARFKYALKRELEFPKQTPQTHTFPNGSPKKTIVILGTGWGSIALLKSLDTSLYNVIVVSPRDYYLFTPLLTSTPVGKVSDSSIVESVRSIARRTPGEVTYYEAEALEVNPRDKTVRARYTTNGNDGGDGAEFGIKYDYLVVGVGTEPSTFNVPGVSENASFLKEMWDAQSVRDKIRSAISRAAQLPKGDPERQRLLKFVTVGGGPTGTEFVAELRDYIDQDLAMKHPEIANEIQMTLVESKPHILSMFGPKQVEYAERQLRDTNIDLQLGTRVNSVTPTELTANCDGEELRIPYGVLVWTAGTQQRELTRQLKADLEKNRDETVDGEHTSRTRGLRVNERLQLIGAEDSIYAIGDCAYREGLPQLGNVARQEGEYLAKTFRLLHEAEQLKWENPDSKRADEILNGIGNFKYHHRGLLAYLGQNKAIAYIAGKGPRGLTLNGRLGFRIWKRAHLGMTYSPEQLAMIKDDWERTEKSGRSLDL